MSGLIGFAVLLAVVVIFLGPRRNSDTGSPGYDRSRDNLDPSGWHSAPLWKEWRKKGKR